MLRDLTAVALLAATIAGIWQLGTLRPALFSGPNTPLQRKMQEADRIVHYRFDEDEGPVFHLDGDEAKLRLVTHLVLEPGAVYSSDDTYDYGLRLSIDAPDGETIWRRDIHTSTRQSKDGWLDGQWMRENAFSLQPGVEITDDRVHLVTLPRDVPWGSRFRVYLDAEGTDHGVIRAYEHSWDTSLGLSRTYVSPGPREERRLVGRLTYLPWDALSVEQREARLRHRWTRMSAQGELGDDYAVDSIYYTGFRAPPLELPPPALPPLVGDRATALTAWGPGLVTLWIDAQCPDRDGDARGSLSMVHLNALGVVDRRRIDPCRGETVESWLPPGPHTIHLRADALPETRIEAWYDDYGEAPLERPGLERGRALRQTITRSSQLRLDTDLAPADYALVEPDDLESAMLQLRARLPVAPRSEPAAQQPATIRYTFTDRRGAPLGRGEWRVEPTAELDAYESVVDVTDPDRRWWVSAAQSTRFIIPQGTHRLRLESEGAAVVSVHTYWSGLSEPPRLPAPYDQAMLVGTRWRRVAVENPRWFRLSPANDQELQRSGQRVDVVGPVRLEPLDSGGALLPSWHGSPDDARPPGEPSWVTLAPQTRHERRTVLARTEPSSPWARFARWRPGRATLNIDDNRDTRLVFLVEGPPEAALGQRITVTIDGHTIDPMLASTRGRWKLPGLGPGHHALELGPLPEGVRVLLDRPGLEPLGGPPPRYRVLTLHRLGGRTMRLRADKTEASTQYINAIAYRCGAAEPTSVRIEIDGSAPARRRGVAVKRVTQATREHSLPARGQPTELVFLDRSQARCEDLGRLSIPLGSDLRQGRHDVTLRVTEGPDVWVRFFRHGTDEAASERVTQWTERLPAFDEPTEGP